jgi:predicted transcriptional regulator
MKVLDIYDSLMEEIQSVYRSRLLIQMLLSLYEGDKTLAQLREVTGSTSQAIIPKIRILESADYITMIEYEYRLSPLGRILAGKIYDHVRTTGSIKRHQQFFSTHHLEGIPAPFLSDIGDLYDSRIISDTNVEIFNVFFNFIKMVDEGFRICILSPISSPAHTEAVARRVAEGIPVELVVGKDLAHQLFQPGYIETIQPVLEQGKNLRILVTEKRIPVGLTVTDKGLSLGLYKNDGITYDTTTDLFSHDPAAVAWGQRLFDYYQKDARKLPP